ncbi:ribonuclease HII [[Mycoplasma] anseris]|uniref:Ribonuclease n=1 Tax=[Mycoplasma] anseris TaxID=92400 RepID=A0A2Z4NDD6_9BACT|nr:ribonuclease HII [[Mycoplasma] anseris]AWX69602.1 ribonuclease HII [[Mycoplasma] anseris]
MRYWIEQDYPKTLIAGCDEAGRGPSAGPLVAACCILPVGYENDHINDSKLLTEKQREELFEIIIKKAIEYQIVFVDSKMVDELNPKRASQYAMEQCIKKLQKKPRLIITDFEKLNINNIEQINLIKGDQLSINVAAASILAKVVRDRYMVQISKKYPQYRFNKNKGYFTEEHKNACLKYGICDIHRRSYKNIKEIIEKRKK